MKTPLTINVKIDPNYLENRLQVLTTNDRVMLEVHNLLHRYCYDYVPFAEGSLDDAVNITPNYVQYTSPYAHYQYEGQAYGVNVPHINKENGTIFFRSPAGSTKVPNGNPLNYNPTYTIGDITYTPHPPFHPKATAHWDEAMMEERGDEFKEAVKDALLREADRYG